MHDLRIQRDRAEAALLGLAIGDALGMPTQTLSPEQIAQRYGEVEGLVAPFVDHPVSHGLTAGRITDDTEQALLLARRLIGGGDWDERGWADDLLSWESSVRDRGLHDLLGPSTKRALQALLDGADPSQTGRLGTTNGAAMRIAPVGICSRPETCAILDAVERISQITHATRPAIAAASAVAGAVSAGLEGSDWPEALEFGLACANSARNRGVWVDGADVASRIAWALRASQPGGPTVGELTALLGTSVLATESVPCAFGLVAAARGDPWRACLLAANAGGDTDTMGAIAGTIAGACSGTVGFPANEIRMVTEVNELDFGAVLDGLLALRNR